MCEGYPLARHTRQPGSGTLLLHRLHYYAVRLFRNAAASVVRRRGLLADGVYLEAKFVARHSAQTEMSTRPSLQLESTSPPCHTLYLINVCSPVVVVHKLAKRIAQHTAAARQTSMAKLVMNHGALFVQ